MLKKQDHWALKKILLKLVLIKDKQLKKKNINNILAIHPKNFQIIVKLKIPEIIDRI
jgi:hypothetical protein